MDVTAANCLVPLFHPLFELRANWGWMEVGSEVTTRTLAWSSREAGHTCTHHIEPCAKLGNSATL